jgi:HAD superfamily hydrolase (TIGR01549 family)
MIVLFDLEGTLAETCFERDPEEVQVLRAMARRTIQELGIPRDILGDEGTSSGMRNRALEYARGNLPEAYGEEVERGIRQFMDIWEARMAETYRLYPEAVQVLEELSGTGCRLGLVTSTTRRNVDYAFRKFGLGGYFQAVVAREDVPFLKPDPAGIRKALVALGASESATEFLLVGDSAHDVRAARNAGGLSVGIDRGSSRLDGVSPDFEIDSLLGLIEIVRDRIDR